MNPSRLVKTLKSAPSEIVIASKLFLRTFDRLVFTLKFSSTSERFQKLCLRLFGFDYFPFTVVFCWQLVIIIMVSKAWWAKCWNLDISM